RIARTTVCDAAVVFAFRRAAADEAEIAVSGQTSHQGPALPVPDRRDRRVQRQGGDGSRDRGEREKALRPAGAALRVAIEGVADRVSGHGYSGKGWRDPAHLLRCEPAGLPGRLLQSTDADRDAA